MVQRWNKILIEKLPRLDLYDLTSRQILCSSHNIEIEPQDMSKRACQNMPEVAQEAYLNALARDVAIGDYTAIADNSVQITDEFRVYMVTTIKELCRIKSYKDETLYMACSIADRYLASIIKEAKPGPCLIKLAITSTLLAAKHEESI